MSATRDSESRHPTRRVLVTGAGGMLGRAVVDAFSVSATVQPLLRDDCDLTDASRTRQFIGSRAPHVIVHCAAWTDVDACEDDPARAELENATATRHVAEAAAQVGAALCYVSTDYVFDGTKVDAYLENDPPGPINAYGRSKHAGEAHVLQALPNSWVVRSSWLFGPGGRNFVRTMVDLLRQRREVRVVDDQVGCPTYTADLAQALRALVATRMFGIFHVTNAGSCSWHQLAEAIESKLRTGCRVLPCPSAEMPRRARRPRNSVLENRRYDAAGLWQRRHWRDALHAYMSREWETAE